MNTPVDAASAPRPTQHPEATSATVQGDQTGPESPVDLSFQSEPVPPPKNTVAALLVLACLAWLLAGAGGVFYLFHLRHRVNQLQAQQTQTRTVADSALKIVQGIPVPKDFSPDIARIEGTVQNRFRILDEAQKAVQAELDKLRTLESKIVEGDKANATALTSAVTPLQHLRERADKHEQNLASLIAILRNQEQIIRQMVQRDTPSAQ